MRKKNTRKKETIKKFGNQEVIFLIILTCIVGITMGYFIGGKQNKQIKLDNNLKEFINTYYEIKDNYYKKIDEEELLNGAVNGILSSLDEHSILIDNDSDETFNLNLEGSYSGIGIEIINNSEGNIYIVGILDNSPAKKAGLQVGDIIKKADNINMVGEKIGVLSSYIRKNTKKDTFTLIIERENKELTYTIKKESVVIKSVASKTIEKNGKLIGYIYISIFSNTTTSQFLDELNKLEKQGIDSLIIDVRENTGGHLSTVARILSNMLDSKKVIYQINKDGKKTKYYSMGNHDKTYKIAILQNENSASASEMLSISLKENLNAIIVGEKSYGKGSVQELNHLNNGASYKYTTKLWLSPNGNSIDGIGIKPDITVQLDENYFNNPSDETDNQLQTAISELIK